MPAGVIMPVICFVFDPIVFKNGLDDIDINDAILSNYRPFAYVLSFASIMALLAWMIWGEKLKGFAVVVSGILAAGAAVSLVIGILLFPLSFFCLIFLIGILGFTPLFTFASFWRNSRQAFLAARPYLERRVLIGTTGLVMLSALAVPMIINAAMKVNMVTRLLEIVIIGH